MFSPSSSLAFIIAFISVHLRSSVANLNSVYLSEAAPTPSASPSASSQKSTPPKPGAPVPCSNPISFPTPISTGPSTKSQSPHKDPPSHKPDPPKPRPREQIYTRASPVSPAMHPDTPYSKHYRAPAKLAESASRTFPPIPSPHSQKPCPHTPDIPSLPSPPSSCPSSRAPN